MLPLQIASQDISISTALEQLIRKKVEKLTQFYKRIVSCRVAIELAQKHKHQGKLYNVRIEVTVPGKVIAVTKKVDQDLYIAIRDAFKATERRLEEHANKKKGEVKTHNKVLNGQIARMIPEEGYGFIEGADGNEYYFSITNMSHPEFSQLSLGDSVEYIPIQGNDGHQAHHVIRIKENGD